MGTRTVLASLLLAAALAWSWASFPLTPRSTDLPTRVDCGEALLHGVGFGPVSETMPLSSIASAVVRHHLPHGWGERVTRLLLLASVGAVFVLGMLLHSPLCGGLAAVLAALLCFQERLDNLEQVFFGLLLLLLACLLADRARRPARGRDRAAGLALGLSLLVRSSLVLFAPVLTAWELFRSRALPLRERARRLVWFWALPALLLLPWVWMNAAVHHRFIPFEMARADESLVAGAMGWLSTVEGGDIFAAAGISEGSDPAAWAAREMARHPLRTLGAAAVRAWHAAGLHPWLVLLGLFGLWLLRGDEAAAQTGLLAACFIGTHCLIGAVPRYFEPVWPLVCVPAAAAAAWLLSPRAPDASPLPAVRAALVAAAGAAAFTLIFVLLYPFRAGGGEAAFRRELDANRQDPFLWTRSGDRDLAAGRFGEAVLDFRMAEALDPHESRRARLARAMLAAGGEAARGLDSLRFENPVYIPEAKLALGLAALRRGDSGAGERYIAQSRQAWESSCRLLWTVGRPGEREARESLCAGAPGWEAMALSMLDPLPDAEFERLIGSLGGMDAERMDHYLREASIDLDIGEPERAARLLRRIRYALGDAGLERGLRLAALQSRAGMPEDAYASLRSLSRRFSGSAEAAVRLAEAAAAVGKARIAEEALRRASSLELSPAQLRSAAATAGRVGSTALARGLLESLTEEVPWDFEAWHAGTEAALAEGDCVGAERALAGAGAAARDHHAKGRVDGLAQRFGAACK